MSNFKIRQNKILKILNLFSKQRLEKITEGKFTFEGMSEREVYLFMECVWTTLGKTTATKEEIIKGIKEVLILANLKVLQERGLVTLNDKGYFKRTRLGDEIKKGATKK